MITVSNVFNRIPTLFADLAKLLTGDIDCSALTLSNYSKDNSPYLVLPQAVIYPKNVTDIKHTLAFAREYTMPVTVRGKGTGSTGGALGEGIILDLTRYFSQIRNINMMENTITVDAGVTVSSLLEKLHTWHYDIPILSTNDTHTTIGALIATKNTQSSSFRHGTIREWIEGLTVVVDTGEEHILQDGITPSGRLLGIYQEIFPFMTQEHPTIRASKPLTHDDATGAGGRTCQRVNRKFHRLDKAE
jgi:FAD/FMN-containing dehydrogenase